MFVEMNHGFKKTALFEAAENDTLSYKMLSNIFVKLPTFSTDKKSLEKPEGQYG